MIFFSKNTGGFYDTDIHSEADIPADALEITAEQYQNMLTHLNTSGRIDHNGEEFALIAAAPDAYHIWNETNKAWETNDELQAKKQADADALKQAEIASFLTQAARKVSEYQDLVDFAETPEESAAGEAGYNAWRQYRASLLKYQKGLIADMPSQPE